MVKEQGQVIRVEDDTIWVASSVKSTCHSCAAKSNCGTGSIAGAFAGKQVINPVKNTLNATLHDWVEIGIPEATMVRGAFLLYILPLLLALLLALITQTWLNELLQTGEGAVIVMTLLGGAAGFVLANRLLRQSDLNEPQQAKLLKVLANNALAIPIQEVDSH